MQYYNLKNQAEVVSFEEATLKGLGSGKGLYFPQEIPRLSTDFMKYIGRHSKEEIGVEVMKPYVAGSLPDNVLEDIVRDTINFPFPLMKINENIYSLELFHGPTFAFKDVGARFMSRCLAYFNRNSDTKTTVLVATSGDTGGAVANGFEGIDNVNVVILYPSGKVSHVQELQLTTGGNNITALEVKGTFDDCQDLVKKAFADDDLNKKLKLTSANSINVARWLPQQLYYFTGYTQWINQNTEPPVISVPSGNFGNICAGILAHISGLPVKHFIAACNVNDTIPRFLQNGSYDPKPAVATVSNAMDIAEPSNFVRILEIFNENISSLKEVLSSISVDDETTKDTIRDIYYREHYLLDPHGAVAFIALRKYLETHPQDQGLILETAHPVKFPDVIQHELKIGVPVPHRAEHLFKKEKHSVVINPDFNEVKDFLMAHA